MTRATGCRDEQAARQVLARWEREAEQVKAGTMRLLAVSSAERLEGIDAPTIKESGFDVVVENWRMVAAAPGLSDEQKAKIAGDIEKLNASAGWTKMLSDKGWTNTYLAGDAFAIGAVFVAFGIVLAAGKFLGGLGDLQQIVERAHRHADGVLHVGHDLAGLSLPTTHIE